MAKTDGITVAIADQPNGNNRVYSRELLERLVEQFQPGTMFGEIGPANSSTVSFSRASHLVRRLYLDGDSLKVDIEVLKTPMGYVLEQMLSEVVFRPRGIGSTHVNELNQLAVDDCYKLVTIDALEVGQGAELQLGGVN